MIKKIGIPLIVFMLLLPVSPGFIAFPQNQNPNYTLTIPDYPVWAAIGDVDNDALNDIVITTSEVTSATGENDGVKVFYQLADGSFHASPDTNITQRLPYQVLIADADHDGDNDIITNNMDLQTISIFYRNHDGLSTTQDVELKTGEGTGDYAWSIATGHFNNDNYLDLVVGCGQWIKPNTWIDSLKIFYGPFTDNQAPGTTITLGNNIGPSSLVIGYLNQDTKDDIAMTCYDKNQLYIFYQTLEGTFSTTPDTILTTSAVPNAVDIGYLNDDLKIDIATCLDNGKIDVYYQSSGFPQNPSATLDTQTTKAHDICIANVDDKYRDDIIVTSLLGTKIFYQTSGGTLPNTPDYTLTNSYDDYLTVGLLNTKTDMMNDIVTLNVGTDTAAVFYQDPPAVGIAVREIKIKESTNPYLLINETVQVKTTISNDGITDATNLHVRLYIDSLQQASYTISSLAHGASTTISPKNFTWKCSVLGEHYVNVTVDVKPGESNTDNNKLEFKPKPLVRAPDLAPLAVTVEGNIGGGATLSATIINYGDGDASYPGGIQVRFYSADPGTNPDHPSLITTSKIQGTLLADNRRTTVTGQWNNPQADTTIWVWVDPLKHVDESSEGNNKNFISIGSAPVVTQIRPWYLNYEVDVENIFVFSNKDILITYKATVENYAPIIKTSFTLTGPGTDDSYDDVDGSDGWSWALNLNGKDQGTYTLTAQANNSLGVTSNIKTYHIYVIEFPEWASDLSITEGPISISFSGGKLRFKISSDGWDFFEDSDDGAGSGNDPLTGGETESETSTEFSAEFCSDGTGTIEGSAGGETKTLGKTQKFEKTKKVEAGVGFTANIRIIPESYSVELESAEIKFTISVTFEHLYGIAIPVIDKGVGIKISGQPKLEVTYSFDTENGQIAHQGLTLDFAVRLQGGLCIDLELAGAEVYGYAEPGLTGYIGNEPGKKPFSIRCAVGAGGSAWAGPYKWEGELEAFKWEWPSSRNVSFTDWTQSLRPMFGSNTSAGLDKNISSDIYYDDYPYIAADYAGNTYALWVRNTTIPNESQVMYSVYNGVTWAQPQILSDTHHEETYPVIAFDAINNNGVAAWVHNTADLFRSTPYPEYQTAYKNTELYTAVFNSSTQTWSAAQPLTNDLSADTFPAIAADTNGNVMLIWVQDADGNASTPVDKDLYYSIWNTHTNLWTAPALVAGGFFDMDTQPAVAYDSTGKAGVVWVHDSDSTRSSFDNQPPQIMELFATPSPALLNNYITLYGKVVDDMIETEVTAEVTYPDLTVLEYSFVFNATSGYYEAVFQATQEGVYQIEVTALDSSDQHQVASLSLFVGFTVDEPPVITNPYVTKNLAHINNPVTISATVTDDVNVNAVWVNITGAAVSSIMLQDLDHDTVYTGSFTPLVTGDYTILISANDSSDQLTSAGTFCTALDRMDTEIYYSVYTPGAGGGWSIAVVLSNAFDYQESSNPSIVYDIRDNAAIAWEEKIGDPENRIYTSYIPAGCQGFCDCQQAEQAVNVPYGNSEPKLIRSNNGFVMLTWRGDDPASLWPELYYSVLNTTRLTQGFAGEYCTPVWGNPFRLTANGIPDKKPTVAIDPLTNMVTTVWLGHATMVSNQTTFNSTPLQQDDDDLYYKSFMFPLRMEGLNEVTRFADGTIRKTFVFDTVTHNQTVYLKIPEFSYPFYDARMILSETPDQNGNILHNVSIDLGDDGTTEYFIEELNGTQTYYLNALDGCNAFDTYLQNHWFIEASDGEADGKILVPFRIHSDTPGILQLSHVMIGFSYTETQRDCVEGLSTDEHPTIVRSFNQRYPSIYADNIAYQDYSGTDSNVYIYNITQQQDITQITRPGNQEYPDLSSNLVAYQDNRNPTFNSDIYYYNIAQGIEYWVQLGNPTYQQANQLHPDVSQDRIVYDDNRYGGYGIYLYNITTLIEEPIVPYTSPYQNQYPAISGDYIVWQRYNPSTRWDIWLYNLKTYMMMPLIVAPGDQTFPEIDNDSVVWQDTRSGSNPDIYLFNLSSMQEHQITNTPSIADIVPTVHAHRITWQAPGSAQDIYLFDEDTNQIYQVTTDTNNQINPQIYHDTIVWEDNRYANYDIFTATIQHNHAPVLTPIPDFTINETEVVWFTTNAVDPDHDSLVYYCNDTRFNQDHNYCTWQTQQGDQGSYQLLVTVSDCCYNITRLINITVLDDNKPPVLLPLSDSIINESEDAVVTVFATDINDDALFYAINDSRFEQSTNTFTWHTQLGDVGTYAFTVTVSDGTYNDTQLVNITLNIHQNSPPYIPHSPTPSNGETNIDINQNLSWVGGDPDNGDNVTYDVFFGNTSPPIQIASNISQTTYEPGTLDYDTQYYWQIKAWDNHYTSNTSQIWTFTTEEEPVTELVLDGSCYYQNMSPVIPVNITIINLNMSETWQAQTNNQYYTLTLIIGDDITAGQILRYIARDMNESVNVTDYTVSTSEITSGVLHLNLILTIHYRDLKSFPWYESQVNTGAMTMKMMLDYLMWNGTVNPLGPPSVYNEQTLYNTYKGSDSAINGSELTYGLNHEIDDQAHGWIYGYFFSPFASTNATDVLKQICYWLDYPVEYYNDIRDVDVPKPGHPNHVPIAVPLEGTYNHWAVVRGIHTDRNAWLPPTQLNVYGFWVNDPKPGGLGTNTYVTTSRFLSTYFLNLTVPGDSYTGKRLAITDPPQGIPIPESNTQVRFVDSPPYFTVDDAKVVVRTGKTSSPQTDSIVIYAAHDAAWDVLKYDPVYAGLFMTAKASGKPIYDKTTCTVLFKADMYMFKVILQKSDGVLQEIQIKPVLMSQIL